jgi:DUF1365 family protein
MLAEVSNTPWRERHVYALAREDSTGRVLRARIDKNFHVSPFMGMDAEYDWRMTEPGEDLQVHIESRREGRTQSVRMKLKGAPYHAHPPVSAKAPR